MDRSHVVTDTTIPQTAQIIDNIVIWEAASDIACSVSGNNKTNCDIFIRWDNASKTITLDLCQRMPCLAMRQRGILFWILELLLISLWWGRYFQVFLLYLGIVNKTRQVSVQFMNLPIASSSHAGDAIFSLHDSLQPLVIKFRKNVKNCSPSVQAVEITF